MKLLPKKSKNTPKHSGFTIIEVLIVVVLLSILSGLVIMIIDPAAQRDKAQSATNQATAEKLVQGLQAYYAAEGNYPDPEPDPFSEPMDPVAKVYLNSWPEGFIYYATAPLNNFSVSGPMTDDPEGPRVKYFNLSDPSQDQCGGQILLNCPNGNLPFDSSGCVTLTGVTCVGGGEDEGVGPAPE